MIGPTNLDLTTVAEAVAWIFGASANVGQNTGVLQTLISSLSLDFLRRTGRAAQDGSVPALSPFNQAVDYVENYTGNGNELLQIRNWPIQSVASVSILGTLFPQSTGPLSYGWYIEHSGQFLGARMGPLGVGYMGQVWSGLRGTLGGVAVRPGWPNVIDGITVSYSAGFAARAISAELQTIPVLPASWIASHGYGNGATIFDGTNVQVAQIISGNNPIVNAGSSTPSWNGTKGDATADGAFLSWTNLGPPYALTVSQLPWLSDSGVKYFSNGSPLAVSAIAPTAGQYYLAGGGSYLFNAADAGKQVLISYSASGTPADIQETMLRWVNLIYKRRGWEGIRSLMQKDAGSTTYTSFEVDPSFAKVFNYYRRRA